ncbi:response regulator [Geothermobacter hydrogeniphilus]|uniref:Response regulator n=1 Tax=Geothermobacter hydrogeniphilus TaxID=1969733 RepID=A0A2K2HAG3_9BACT|nr:response regulator [Geothermobacter hydrogeniphilus]PNU20219.1 response regulator [Geothermobacter hydrogeniphilus]
MKKRILIAEDNPQLAASLQTLLERRGLDCEIAADGVSALTRIVRQPPDLLLLDLRLPRLHGIELLKKLRQSAKTRSLPVIIATGIYKGDKYLQAARKLGVRHYLEKPFKGAELLAAVKAELQPAEVTEQPFADILAGAFLDRFSGRLQLRSPQQHCNLDLIDGRPVALSPGMTQPDFGTWLQSRGLLSAEEYAWYRHADKGRHTALVEMGCLTYPDLLQEKLAWLSTELVACFTLPPLGVNRRPYRLPPRLQVVAVNVPRVLYEGFHHHPPTGDGLLTRHGGEYVALADNYYRYINFLCLEEEEKKLLPRLDGQQTLQAALAGLDIGRALLHTLDKLEMIRFAVRPIPAAEPGERPVRTLFNDLEIEADAVEEKLENFGDVLAGEDESAEFVMPAENAASTESSDNSLAAEVRRAHAELQGKNYYEVFGLRSGEFSFDLLKQRYFKLTRKFGPETLMQLGGEEAALVEEILSTVSNAYNTLSDVVKKENYDQLLGSDKVGLGEAGDERFQARIQFQSGLTFLAMEEWEEAEKALQDACNIDTNNGIYLANLAWVIYKNPNNAQSRAMRDKARQLLARALTLERSSEGFAYKGWIHLDAGQDSLAEAEFGKALKLDPRQRLARRGLKQLREKREQEKKGLFKRMFG